MDYISTMDYLIEVFAFYIVPQARLQNAKLFSILAKKLVSSSTFDLAVLQGDTKTKMTHPR